MYADRVRSTTSSADAPPRSFTFDALLGGTLLVVWSAGIWIALSSGWYPIAPGAYLLAGVLCAVALAFTRRFPLPVLVLVSLGCIYVSSFPVLIELQTIPIAVAGFIAISFGRHGVIAIVIALVPTAVIVAPLLSEVAPFGGPPLAAESDPSSRILSAGIVVSVIAIAWSYRMQRAAVTALRDRNAELVVLRKADAARIAAEERSALAREIHDVVAHHLAAMVIRAQAAVRVAGQRPQELTATVEWIASSGQEALASIREVVRVLRDDRLETALESEPEFEPAFDAIVERVRSTGLTVRSTVDLPPRLSTALQFAILRVLQESVTNVMLHSDATTITVALRSREHVVGLRITDNGLPLEALDHSHLRSPGEVGAGVRGMRERVEALGGTLHAGPTEPSGWRVEAVLPLDGPKAT